MDIKLDPNVWKSEQIENIFGSPISAKDKVRIGATVVEMVYDVSRQLMREAEMKGQRAADIEYLLMVSSRLYEALQHYRSDQQHAAHGGDNYVTIGPEENIPHRYVMRVFGHRILNMPDFVDGEIEILSRIKNKS